MDEILWCYHSNETSSAVLSHGTICLVCSLKFKSDDEILWSGDHSNESSLVVRSQGVSCFQFQYFTNWNLENLLNFDFGPF